MDGCVNPYNFVRPGEPAEKDKPKGHDKFEGLSGKITCNLKLVTPIFVPDPEKRVEIEEGENKGHKILEFFKIDNKPVIPPTEIKGMIRSVAEAASNSCFSVFDGGRLDYRTTKKLIAGKVLSCPTESQPGEIQGMKSAWIARSPSPPPIPTIDGRRVNIAPIPTGKSNNEEIYIKIGTIRGYINSRGRPIQATFNIVTKTSDTSKPGYMSGMLKITGQNIPNKKRERVFYDNLGTYKFDLKEMKDYNYVLEQQIKRGKKPGGDFKTNFQHKVLSVGDLIYFEKCGNGRACNLSLVEIPRTMYSTGRSDLIDDRFNHCQNIKMLCPACRIFGTVIEKDTKEKTESFAGNISFSVCELKGDNPNLISGQILKILSSPKPTSYNFYLIDPDDPQKVRDYDGRAIERRGRGFSPNPRNIEEVELRGRKFYWHQPYDETLKRYTTTKEELMSNNQKLGLTSSVELLLPPAEFTFTVTFDNLDDSELGLLLWSLELEKEMGHKLGMGKPLGLGSVEINIEKLEIIDRATRYTEIFSSGVQDKTAERQKNYIDGAFKKKLEAENSSKEFDEIPNVSDLKKIMDLQSPPQNNVKYPGDFHWFASHKDLPLPTIEETVNDKKSLRDCRS